MNKLIIFIALSLSVLTLCSCQNVNTVERKDPIAQPNQIDTANVIRDPSLGFAIHIVGLNESMVSGDLLKVQATVENRGIRAKSISYRFYWYDVDGMEVTAPSNSWRSLRMEGSEPRSVSAVAPNPRVVDFRFHIVEAK